MEIHSLFACTVQHVVNHEVLLQGLSKKLSCEARGLEAGELLGCKLGVENESLQEPLGLCQCPAFRKYLQGLQLAGYSTGHGKLSKHTIKATQPTSASQGTPLFP